MVCLNGPPSLVDEKDLPCSQIYEIGHQYLCFLRAHVTPFFTQNHGDITDMTKTSAFSVYPTGLSAGIIRQPRNPRSLKTSVRNVLDQIVQALTVFQVLAMANTKPQRRFRSDRSSTLISRILSLEANAASAITTTTLAQGGGSNLLSISRNSSFSVL
jgi:hypothetical protein